MKFLKMATRPTLLLIILGLVLAILVGCGNGHGPYRHGYDDQNNYRGGYGYSRNAYSATQFKSGNRNYGSIGGYGHNQNAYCAW